MLIYAEDHVLADSCAALSVHWPAISLAAGAAGSTCGPRYASSWGLNTS